MFSYGSFFHNNKRSIASVKEIIGCLFDYLNIYIYCLTRYSITTDLSSRVSHLNPRWNDPDPDPEVCCPYQV